MTSPVRISDLDDEELLGDIDMVDDVVSVTCGSRHSALLTRSGRVIVM